MSDTINITDACVDNRTDKTIVSNKKNQIAPVLGETFAFLEFFPFLQRLV